MKFLLGDTGVTCTVCGHMFPTPLPRDREITIECPTCATKAVYWIEWYIAEIEEEEDISVF